MHDDANPFAAPQAAGADTLGAQSAGYGQVGNGPWRDGDLLVVNARTALPERCVRCNEPSEGRPLRRQLAWHPAWVFLLVLVSPVIYIIVALIVRKTMTVHAGLCGRHRSTRRRALAVAWLVGLAGVAVLVAAFTVFDEPVVALGILGGFALIIGGAGIGIYYGGVLSPKRIDSQYAWARGACRDYLEPLPEWPG